MILILKRRCCKKIKKINYLNSNVLINFDIVILMTDHDIFDYDLIKKNQN